MYLICPAYGGAEGAAPKGGLGEKALRLQKIQKTKSGAEQKIISKEERWGEK